MVWVVIMAFGQGITDTFIGNWGMDMTVLLGIFVDGCFQQIIKRIPGIMHHSPVIMVLLNEACAWRVYALLVY